MIGITCEKCRRRFTPTVDEIKSHLAQAQGRKHAIVICPHCGKHNKVSPERLREAVRFSPPPATAVTPGEPAAEGE